MWGNCESADKAGMRENTLSFANIRPKKLTVTSSQEGEGTILFVKVAAGAYHNAAIDKNGHIYTWGDSSSGCLGHEKTNDRTIPTEITGLHHKKVIDVACGEKFTVLIVSNKDAKVASKCVEEFNYNSIKTFQERLKAINDFNYKKKKFRIERKKKELSYAPPDEIKIPITKISSKKITDQLTKFYVQKSVETNPKNRDKMDFKIPFLGINNSHDELVDVHNTSHSDKYKDTSTSIVKPPSLTKLEQVPEGNEHEDDANVDKRKPKRGLTISPQIKFGSKKDLGEYLEGAPKSTHDRKKKFFGTPPSKQSIHKPSEPKRALTTVPNSPSINYVFDSVTEHLNERNDFYHEFNAVMKISKPMDDMTTQNSYRPTTEPKQTIKQVEGELHRKSHVRTSEFESLTNSKVMPRTSRPQTAKSSQGYNKFDFASPKISTFTATASHYASQMVRPLSSNSAGRLMKVKRKSSEEHDSYDFVKAFQIQKHQEKVENRYKMLAERRIQHIQDLAAERDYKIKLVQEKKTIMQLEKKHKIADMTYKRSTEFKNLVEHIKDRKAQIEHMQKQLIGFIGCQHLLYTIKLIIKQSHDKSYFQRIQNAKASKIQKTWKKFKIVQRIEKLSEKQKNIIRMMIMRFVIKRKRILEAKRLRKVYLMFQYFNLSKKIAQKLLALRNIIIPIQKFVLWSRRVFRLRFRKLALAWDMNIMKMSNIKFEDNKLVSTNAGKSALEYGSPTKTNSRVEANMNKQKKIIESELSSLGLNKKETNKKAGDIKTRFEVIMDHMKLRGAMLSIEGEDAQKQMQQQPSQSGPHIQRKSIAGEAKSATNVKGDLVITFDLIIKDTILPYNSHDAEIAFPPQYTIKKESQSIHEKILPKLTQFEIQLKTKILRDIYEERVMAYAKSIKDYEWQLKDFMIKNRKDIDLERTKMMLSTPKETLRAISRKEETEFRMENANANKRRPMNQLGLGEKDHLPFAKLKIKIAAAMPDAPKFPTYKATLTFDEFKVYFRRFYEEYKNGYAQIIQAARLKGRTAYKG